MKSLVLASMLGSLVGAAAIGGPFHFQVTRPHALFGMLNADATGRAVLSLGQLPLEFVLTDVVVDGPFWTSVYLTVNGSVACALRVNGSGSSFVETLHLNSGIPIPAGATIGVQASGPANESRGVTISGYVQ